MAPGPAQNKPSLAFLNKFLLSCISLQWLPLTLAVCTGLAAKIHDFSKKETYHLNERQIPLKLGINGDSDKGNWLTGAIGQGLAKSDGIAVLIADVDYVTGGFFGLALTGGLGA